eukprot:TRINITY_DN15709_c0_g3_i1.p1 TRINITY_DN15709_c0_g3~~TRINITY_DN15709_c0_g3_i1.p1  ORF type:complete len:227 (-),score=24.38 TRINITY_DN15709_c0_g3_i1:316-996(-)
MGTYKNCRISSSGQVVLDARIFPATYQQLSKPKYSVVLVHQYSLLGGCQDLMQGIAMNLRALDDRVTVLTFDMRGVGGSSGVSSVRGHAEVDDVLSVCEWVAKSICENIVLVGSSAGAPIAGSAVRLFPNVKAYVAIGYTFGRLSSILFGGHYKNIITSEKPKLFIMGDKDGFTSIAQLDAKMKEFKGDLNERKVFDGVGHFELETAKYDRQLASLILQFADKIFS